MEPLPAPIHVTRRPATATAHRRTVPIGRIGVDPLFHRPGRHAHGLTPDGGLQRFEIPILDRARSDQRCDLGRDFGRERGFEAPFFAVSFEPGPSVCLNSASHKRSLAATTSWANTRKRWHSAICCRVWSTASRGMIFVTVLPFTAWVSEKLGPWPRSPARAHRQLGLPHRRYRATSEPGRISPHRRQVGAQLIAPLAKLRDRFVTDGHTRPPD